MMWLLMGFTSMAVLAPGAMASRGGSVFTPPELVENARRNAREHPWAARMQKEIVAAARPWRRLSDEALWSLMFGPTIKRSWMVWSNGHCPACRKSVPMYSWQMAALKEPWKVRCPHCRELFPKNDFGRFYRSGLDEHGVFDPKRADRSLLYNAEHPDPLDPLHRFGVDDGEGYVEGTAKRQGRWRFIGAYLIYGQWKQAVLGGIRSLAAAYVVNGDQAYAHKAGVLLDRVADLYPTFDFGKEGVMYEGPPRSGYISTWHDACEETRELALAYDQVRGALAEDRRLVSFLRRKARQFKLENGKASWEEIRSNIEARILRDALSQRDKIYSNYPRTEITVATIRTVLGWPGEREEILASLDPVLEKATAVDGVTGEKGLAGYTAFTIQGVALLLATYARMDPGFLTAILQRHPRLRQMFRFHIDTWCLERYYPQSGDTGAFAQPVTQYVGVSFSRNPGVGPSMFTFLWQLYEATGDPAFVQVLYRANDNSVRELPLDLFAPDPAGFQKRVAETIARVGTTPALGSLNKQEWHLAILRSGRDEHARALWLDYDAGGAHGHRDGLNLGLFARGLDLLPEFGYPPVQFGGWGAPRATWYTMTAAHNTVVVDGQNQRAGNGKTTLWADGQQLRVIRAAAEALTGGQQYERTAAMVELSDADFYVLDLFRVVGGKDHAKFMHSHFGTATPHGLALQPTGEYGFDTQMRQFRHDPSPAPGWSVAWKVEDRLRLLPPGAAVNLRYTDLTTGAEVALAEGWICEGFSLESQEAWIPRLMVRRRAAAGPLASTFVGVIEPYGERSNLGAIRRLPLQTPDGAACPTADVAVEVDRADGGQDLLIAIDAANRSAPAAKSVVQPEWAARLDGELCLVRRDAAGAVRRIALCRGRSVRVGEILVTLKRETEFVEVALEAGQASVVAGDAGAVEEITVSGRTVGHRGGK
jgi:oligo-alginate lyase